MKLLLLLILTNMLSIHISNSADTSIEKLSIDNTKNLIKVLEYKTDKFHSTIQQKDNCSNQNEITQEKEQTNKSIGTEIKIENKIQCLGKIENEEIPPCENDGESIIVSSTAPMLATFVYSNLNKVEDRSYLENFSKEIINTPSPKTKINILMCDDELKNYFSNLTKMENPRYNKAMIIEEIFRQQLTKQSRQSRQSGSSRSSITLQILNERINIISNKSFCNKKSKWMQDHFKILYNPSKKKGSPFSILSMPHSFSKNISNTIKEACQDLSDVKVLINPLDIQMNSGYGGGNLQVLPNGNILTSTTIRDKFKESISSNFNSIKQKTEILEVIANFLNIGHVDEMFNFISIPKSNEINNNPHCQYAIIVASPEIGANLIDDITSPSINSFLTSKADILLSNKNTLDNPTKQNLLNSSTNSFGESFEGALKQIWENEVKKNSNFPDFNRWLKTQFAINKIDKKYYFHGNITSFNKNVLQKIMDYNLKIVLESLSKSNLELKCPPPVVIKLPALWDQRGRALFPNFTNGISLNGKYLSPSPHMAKKYPIDDISFQDSTQNPNMLGTHNKGWKKLFTKKFKKFIRKTFSDQNISVSFINDVKTHHMNSGEIHCGHNAIRICR
ncbi:MAG: hypothetical protein HQK49_04050 [Oligoflexia bacterium]|nr:hypothetical protein [Oligoflexia bacterium]